jgi:hypothetical protein
MKNYKILENRPELTKQQVIQGMDFAGIKAGAVFPAKVLAGRGLIKTMAAKAVVAKTVISIGLVAASIIGYQKFNNDTTPSRSTLIAADTLIKTQPIANEKKQEQQEISKAISTTSTQTKLPKHEKPMNFPINDTVRPITNVPEIQPVKEVITAVETSEVISAAEVKTVNPLVKAKQPFKQSQNAKCKLWDTKSFCNNAVTRPDLTINMECKDCEFTFISCHDIDNMSNIKGVWLTVDVNDKGKFRIESFFNNMSLERADGKIIHPVALGVGASPNDIKEPKYYSNNFKAKKLVATFKKQIDIFLFFENPKIGDKIFIDNFIQAEIME